jgi:hypothetical protein
LYTHNSSGITFKSKDKKKILWRLSFIEQSQILFVLFHLESIKIVATIKKKNISLFRKPLIILFFESLGLDITSLIFNPFKNGRNIPFLLFISLKESNHTVDFRTIYKNIFNRKAFIKISLGILKLLFLFLSNSLSKITYEVVPTYSFE